MQADLLFITEPQRPTGVPSLAATPRSTSFADALAHSSRTQSAQIQPPPKQPSLAGSAPGVSVTKPLPSAPAGKRPLGPGASEAGSSASNAQIRLTGQGSSASNPPIPLTGQLADEVRIYAGVPATYGGHAGLSVNCEVETGTKPTAASTTGMNSTNTNVKISAEPTAQVKAAPAAKNADSNTATAAPLTPQNLQNSARELASPVLPVALPIAFLNAASSSSDAQVAAASKPPLEAAVASSTSESPVFSEAPALKAPSPVSPTSSGVSARLALFSTSADAAAVGPRAALTQLGFSQESPFIPSETLGTTAGVAAAAPLSSDAPGGGPPRLSFKSAGSVTAPQGSSAPLPSSNVPLATDADSGPASPQISDVPDNADVFRTDPAGFEVTANAPVGPDFSASAPANDGHGNCSDTEPATAAPLVPLTDAAGSVTKSVQIPEATRTNYDGTSLPSQSLSTSFGRPNVRIPATPTPAAELSSAKNTEILRPDAAHTIPSASSVEVRDSTSANTIRNSIHTAPAQAPETAAAQSQPAIDASVPPAYSESNAELLQSSVASDSAPASNTNFDASTPPTTATATADDPASTAQPSSPLSSPSASTPDPKSFDASRSMAPTGPTATAASSVAAATAGTATNPGLVVSSPPQNATAAMAPASTAPEKSGPAADLPPIHERLDSAPVVASDNASAAAVAHSAQVSAPLQMQVGVHTSVFGNVEVHTVVQQNQVGISIHGDRELARWFSSELGGLEAGLKNQHLNLTGVDFSNARSGVQTATGFQHGQPRQNSPQSSGSNVVASSTGATETEPGTELIATTVLSAQEQETRVNILV